MHSIIETPFDQSLRFLEPGCLDYREALDLQESVRCERIADRVPDTIILLQHPPVITFGARSEYNRINVQEQRLVQSGIACVPIRRGGGVTVHNPGQLVIYPIVHLKRRGIGTAQFVHLLENIGRQLLLELGLDCQADAAYPGLWFDGRKIASVGIHVRRWVSMHGIAINIQNDLSLFEWVVPCGIERVTITSLQRETGRTYDLAELNDRLKRIFRTALG